MSKLGTLTALALMIATLFTLGCNGMGAKSGSGGDSITPLPILGRQSGEMSGITTSGVRLISSQEDLAAQGSDALTQWADANVDLSRYSIIVLAAGEQSSGGYWAYVDSAQVQDDVLYVQGIVNRPAPGAATTAVMTSPYSAAVVSKVSPKVRIVPEIEAVIGQPAPADSTLAVTEPEPQVMEEAAPVETDGSTTVEEAPMAEEAPADAS